MTPFWLPKVFAIACGAIFVFGTEARRTAKVLVAGIVVGSLLLQRFGGSTLTWAAGLVLQSAVSVFVLFYLKPPK